VYGTLPGMVFCRACQKEVEDCAHCVFPIQARHIPVVDAKVESLAYDDKTRTLEIAFKVGQVRQVFEVPPDVYHALEDSTITSFLKFMAHRYKSAPVKTGKHAIPVPASEKCPKCEKPMTVRHRVGSDFEKYVRVLWECSCGGGEWRQYGLGPLTEKRGRRH
jgi:hypothetical protein